VDKMTENEISVDKAMTYNKEENSVYIYNQRDINSLDYSLAKTQDRLLTFKVPICYDLKLSFDSSINIPYMADNLFLNMINTGMLMGDFLTIDLSSYRNKIMVQYSNKDKFEGFINKIKSEVYKDIGIKAAVEYESYNKEMDVKVSNYYNIPTKLINKRRMKLLVRLDPYLTDDQLKNQIESIINSKIVDGIIVGGWTVYFQLILEREELFCSRRIE
jgi:hypothetical protein